MRISEISRARTRPVNARGALLGEIVGEPLSDRCRCHVRARCEPERCALALYATTFESVPIGASTDAQKTENNTHIARSSSTRLGLARAPARCPNALGARTSLDRGAVVVAADRYLGERQYLRILFEGASHAVGLARQGRLPPARLAETNASIPLMRDGHRNYNHLTLTVIGCNLYK